MKKSLFFPALALTALVGCSENDVVSVQSPSKIDFAGAFVDNATRAAAVDPSTTTGTIQNFDVWGFMDSATGVIFEDEDVTKVGSDWTYTNIQYWSPSHTYYFAALSPMNSANVTETIADGANALYGLGEIEFTNESAGTEDLLYAATTVTTGSSNFNQKPDPVKFQFNHMLSKVKFTFANGFSNENTELIVKDIKMTAPKKAKINLAQADWWSTNEWELVGTDNVTLEFGDVERLEMGKSDDCANERLSIPADDTQEYTLTFTVELYQGEVLAQTFNETTTIKGVALEIGKAYNFKAELNAANLGLYPIEFDAEVKPWVEAGETFVTLDNATVAAGETLTLVSDGVITGSVNVNGVLDGAGNTLTAEEVPTDNGLIRPAGTATVTNVIVNGGNKSTAKGEGMRAFYITKGGTYVLDNVTTEDVTYAINVSTTQEVSLTVSNSVLEGWTSYGTSTTATFINVSFTKNADAYGVFKPYGTTVLNNCNFSEEVTIDFSELAETVTFNNCYRGDVKITAENINTFGYEAVDVNKLTFN